MTLVQATPLVGMDAICVYRVLGWPPRRHQHRRPPNSPP